MNIRLLFSLFACTGLAQTPLSSILGTVRDPSGAAVPGVRIVLKDQLRGFDRTSVADAQGGYQFDLLLNGNYEISAEAAGFSRWNRVGIPLATRQTLRIDVDLRVGDVTQQVTVDDAPPVISTESAEIHSTTGTRQLFDKIRGGPYGYYVTSQEIARLNAAMTQFRGPGGTANQLRMRIDGTEIGSVLHDPTPPDVIQEVRISSSGLKSESQAPTMVDIVTRGGSNEFHGNVEGLLENPALNALGPFPTATRPPGYPTNRIWYFRGSGPVILPKIYNGRNRTFFWIGRQQSNRTTRGPDNWANFISPPAWRGGDFSRVPSNLFVNTARAVLDPTNGQPFPGNVIPANRISPVTRAIEALSPQPTLSNDPHFTGTNYQYLGTGVMNEHSNRVHNVRLDHMLSSKDTIGYAYGRLSSHWIGEQMRHGTWMEKQIATTRQHTAYWTRIVSPTILNELRVGLSRADTLFGPLLTEESSAELRPKLGDGGGGNASQNRT